VNRARRDADRPEGTEDAARDGAVDLSRDGRWPRDRRSGDRAQRADLGLAHVGSLSASAAASDRFPPGPSGRSDTIANEEATMSKTSAKTVVGAVAAGAAAEYFLDPNNGKRRRHMARDRAIAMVRRPAVRTAREAEQRANYMKGVAEGVVHKATTPGDERDSSRFNDPALARKVETEIFRDREAPKGSVSVNVEAGVVYLRGELESEEEINELVAVTKAVDGVGEVRSLLHLPGQPTASKEHATPR
jgi:osmotically-inducible protein OsmY